MAAGVERGLTEQQHRALTARGVSVALSAGAGCGKTFVLTERFLAHLDPDGPAGSGSTGDQRPRLGELVAITFTERAAREMRDRIRAACRERLLDAPEARVDYWLDLIRELDSARISTIHSFCAALLRSHAVEARLDPQFRVLEQAQADTLLYELIDDELRAHLVARDEAVIDLVVEFGLDSVRGMIAVLLGRRHLIDWDAWRARAPEDLLTRWGSFRDEVVVPKLLEGVARSPEAQALLAIASEHVPDHPVMSERCRTLTERILRLPQSADPAGDLKTILDAAKVQGGGGKKVWPSEAVYGQFRDTAARFRKTIDAAAADVGFDSAAARPAAEAGLRLLSVTRGAAEAYEARKEELAALDFNDLLIRARQLLTAPASEGLRKQLASQIRLLLVDEFQDTDPLQVELVEALCGQAIQRGKLFFVGDYKQSIYRFRGADPHVFGRLRGEMPEEGRLPLTLNFRSQPAILHFVNALFCDELGPEYEPLAPHRPQVSPQPAIEFVWAPDELPEEKSGRSKRLRRREADWIARRIRAMLDQGEQIVWDEEAAQRGEPATRAVRPGDVALLFRALSDVQHYEEALRRYGIDYYLVGGHAFYAQQEIYDLLNLLRTLDTRCDEVSLAGVLRSPMFALEDETLFWLAQPSGGLSAGLFDLPPPDALSDDQRRRVEFAQTTLADLRAIKDRRPTAQLIEEALSRTGYDAVLVAEFLGERKLANLRKLVDQARSFDRSGILSLSGFITQLSEFVARQPDEPLAATHPESSNVVRLMTIHQSKGLEFPVVVVADLDRPMRVSSSPVAFTPQLGPMVKTGAPGGFQLHAAVEKTEERAELTRLLYVATTRAADYLILSGGVRDLDSLRGPWSTFLDRRFDPATGALRTALPADYPEPNVRVTTDQPPLSGKPSDPSARRSLSKLADAAVRQARQGSGRVVPQLEPVAVDRGARRQFSFSRLSGELHAHGEVASAADPHEQGEPSAMPPRLDPLGLGTLVHDLLAEIDFGRPDEVDSWVRSIAPRHLPDVEEGLDEPIEMVRRFLGSPRAAEIAASGQVHRELEFLLAWPPGGREPEPRYLQGYIDCLYQDAAGRWVVLDYKTNRVTDSTIAAVAAGYELQMLLYALAVEQILEASPADLVLHFLRTGEERHFAWDAAARERVVELVNQRLAASVDS